MPTTVDISGFTRGMTGFVDKLGVEGPVVLKKEMGELLKTLIKVTPPKDPKKTRERISAKVNRTFTVLEKQTTDFEGLDVKEGHSGIKWYAASSKYLFGGARDSDMREADDASVLQVFFPTKTVQEHRRIVLPFKHRRTAQQVAILSRVVTKQKQVNAVIARIKNHVGRLKAGWLGMGGSTWKKLNPQGANMPPGWVMKHMPGARGYFIDGLSNKNFPEFTVANYAKGVGNPKVDMTFYVQLALKARAAAMKTNLGLFLSGKKNLSDYAR